MKSKISKQQREIASALGISIDEMISFGVAAAKIMDFVAPSVGERERMASTESQIDFADTLGIDVLNDSRRVASAKIQDQLDKKNLNALKSLNLEPGDKVLYDNGYMIKEHIVSSIKENGKVYFKGIGCPQAWASQIIRVVHPKS